MEFPKENTPEGHALNKQGTPRSDRQQPIIIQNFELLTPNQLKFKKKSLSTANLYLANASLSRQATWTKDNRSGSEQAIKVNHSELPTSSISAADIHMFAHQSPDFAIRAQVDKHAKPPAILSSNHEKSGPRKQVTFAPNVLPTPYSFSVKDKLWHTGNLSRPPFVQTADLNNNKENIFSKHQGIKSQNVSNFNHSSGNGHNAKQAFIEKESSIKGNTQMWHVTPSPGMHAMDIPDKQTRDSRVKGSVSEVSEDRPVTKWHSENDLSKLGYQTLMDTKLPLPAQNKYANGANGVEGEKDGSADISKSTEKHEILMTSTMKAANLDEKKGDTTQKSLSGSSTSAQNGVKAEDNDIKNEDPSTCKSKKVSFKMGGEEENSDEDDDDNSSVTAHVGDTSDLWYDAERSDKNQNNSTLSTHNQQDKNCQQNFSPPMFLVPNLSESVEVSVHHVNQSSRPSSGLSGHAMTPNRKQEKTQKQGNKASQKSTTASPDPAADAGPKVVRLNFLKDEFDIYRRLEDPLHPNNQRLLDQQRVKHSHEKDGDNIVMNIQGQGIRTDVIDTKNKIAQGKRPSSGRLYTASTITHSGQAGTTDPARPKSQGQVNTDYLMQIYSASGERLPKNEISEVSSANEPHMQAEDSKEGDENDNRYKRKNLKESVMQHRDPFAYFSPRTREKERRLLSAAPIRASRSLERPRLRSSSARGKETHSPDKMSSAERYLFKNDPRMAHRTLLNRRLEELVVNSVQYNRSRSVLERSRTYFW